MAHNAKFVSMKSIANRLLQNPLMKELNYEFIVSHAMDCMRLIGAPAMYVEATEALDIVNGKAKIPIGMVNTEGVEISQLSGQSILPMSVATDSLIQHYGKFNSLATQETPPKYQLGGNFIFTNFLEGRILIKYDTFATDSECYPMIPDSVELIRCIRSYIKYMWYDILNDMDRISDRKLNKAETDYAFNAGQAEGNLKMPSIDEMEALTNMVTQILPSRNAHSSRYRFLGEQELMKTQEVKNNNIN